MNGSLPELFLLAAWGERLAAASVDLALFAGLGWLGIGLLRLRGLRRLRSPRLVALIWLLVMVRPLVALVSGPALVLELPAVGVQEAPVLIEREEVSRRSGLSAGPPLERVERLRLAGTSAAAPVAAGAAWLWACGAAVLLLAAALDRLRLRRLLRGAEPAAPELRRRLAEAALRLGVGRERRLPELLVSRDLESPALAGTRRPAVLLPAWLAEAGSGEQLDWALGHELMHWKTGDHLAGAVRQLFQTVFFFHPVAWWVGRRWEEAAELACDRALVGSAEEAASYAERLYEMLAQARGRRRPALAGGIFATRTQIGRRIAALLHGSVSGPDRLSLRSAAALGLVAALSLAVGTGCRPPRGEVTAELELTGPEGTFSLEAEGRFALSRNLNDIESLSPGSRFVLAQTEPGDPVQVEITAGPEGEVRRRYTVDGEERPYGWEARVWMGKALPRFAPYLRSGFRPARFITRPLERMSRHARRLLS